MKKFLTFLIILIIVIAVIWTVIYINKGRIMNFAIDKLVTQMQASINRELPKTISKEQVNTLISTFAEKLKEGTVNKEKLKDVTDYYKESLRDGKIDSLEVIKLIKKLEESIK